MAAVHIRVWEAAFLVLVVVLSFFRCSLALSFLSGVHRKFSLFVTALLALLALLVLLLGAKTFTFAHACLSPGWLLVSGNRQTPKRVPRSQPRLQAHHLPGNRGHDPGKQAHKSSVGVQQKMELVGMGLGFLLFFLLHRSRRDPTAVALLHVDISLLVPVQQQFRRPPSEQWVHGMPVTFLICGVRIACVVIFVVP